MKNFIFILLALAIQGCQHEESNDITELEGSWVSICFSDPASFGAFPATTSSNSVITFSGNNTSAKLNTYSDTNCSTLSSSVPIQDTQFYVNEPYAVTFLIKNETTTINGVTVKEVDFYSFDGSLFPDIFLIISDGSTLYFGKKICQLSNSDLQLICSSERPNELNYDFYFTKLN